VSVHLSGSDIYKESKGNIVSNFHPSLIVSVDVPELVHLHIWVVQGHTLIVKELIVQDRAVIWLTVYPNPSPFVFENLCLFRQGNIGSTVDQRLREVTAK
jgi:hypothetical protein